MGSRKCSEPPAGSSRACKLGFPGQEYILIRRRGRKRPPVRAGEREGGGAAWRFPEREPCKAPGMKRLLESGLPGFRVERM